MRDPQSTQPSMLVRIRDAKDNLLQNNAEPFLQTSNGAHSPGLEGALVHYLLFYDVVPDYVERRAALRAEHLALARAAQARGELVLGGALADPVDGAVLLFRGESPAVAETFAVADPYVTHGLVRRWWVRAWTTVIGDEAAIPLPSETTREQATRGT